MATLQKPSVCNCCGPYVLPCCPTLQDDVTCSATFSEAGNPPNNPPSIVATSEGACGFTGSNAVFDPPAAISVTLTWVPDNPARDTHIGHWQAYWDDLGYNEQTFSASGSTNWCDPTGSYGPATNDSPFCIGDQCAGTSTLTVS